MSRVEDAPHLPVGMARSFLFVPGDRDDRFTKAVDSGADQVVCDLEDAVAPGSKAAARDRAVGWLRSGGSACVRINAVGTAWYDEDLRCLTDVAGLQGVVVPKAETAAGLEQVCSRFGSRVPVIALVETALGIQNAPTIAATEEVSRLAFGSIDYCLDTSARHEEQTLLFPRCSLVVASRAAGKAAPIDGVTQAIHDEETLRRDAQHARTLGFGGKLCIHPSQVAAVNAQFSPTSEEVAWAARVVDQAGGGGVAVIDGQMVDKPVLEQAQLLLRKHLLLSR